MVTLLSLMRPLLSVPALPQVWYFQVKKQPTEKHAIIIPKNRQNSESSCSSGIESEMEVSKNKSC